MLMLHLYAKKMFPSRSRHILVTGGSGFFGGLLMKRLLAQGMRVTNVDRVPDTLVHSELNSIRADVRDRDRIDQIFKANRFDAVVHCAAVLAHGSSLDEEDLWTSNVDGSLCIGEACSRHRVQKLIFISTNCLWAENMGKAIREDDVPSPVEIYGRSKLEAEHVLSRMTDSLHVITIRCPTIIDSGRLGLLAILFEFIQDSKTVWVVGEGSNRYQFISAQDLASACILSLDYQQSDLLHIGSDGVNPLRTVYEAVINEAASRSRVRSLPRGATLKLMQLAHKFGVSPLGPYHYRMIAEDFIFDTQRIKAKLNWRPTLTNEQMLLRAYQYYAGRRAEIHARTDVSAHSKPAEMGVIRLLKWVS